MFLKITKSRKTKYVQLVHSYRENGKIKHKVILNLGRLDQIENNPSFQRLAQRLIQLSKASECNNIHDISQASVVNWGYIIYKKIWKQFGLDQLLQQISSGRKIKFNFSNVCFLVAVQHLLDPRSKLSTHAHQQHYAKLDEVELNSIYRSLDMLCSHKEELEQKIFDQNRNLFNMQIDVVFYDVTTFFFESVRADSLRDFGFSKDCKVNSVQVVLGLLIDCDGRPIGYDLFPGNTFDGKTMGVCLEKLEKRFGIRRVIIVADRGMNSKHNLLKILEKGYSYIFASRLKNMSRSVMEDIFSEGYCDLTDGEKSLRYKIIDYANVVKLGKKRYVLDENLIVTYSEKRAKKDRLDRERLLIKAREYIINKSKALARSKRGARKYLKTVHHSQEINFELDEDAIARDERFDGYYGIQTNEKDMSVKDILSAYSRLWRIEESFRLMKSTLEVRPIFHWTESRIKGHFVVCFLAFLLERTLEIKLRRLGGDASVEKIREAINSLTFTEVTIQDKQFYIKNSGTPLTNKILRLLRISPPKNVTPVEDFNV